MVNPARRIVEYLRADLRLFCEGRVFEGRSQEYGFAHKDVAEHVWPSEFWPARTSQLRPNESEAVDDRAVLAGGVIADLPQAGLVECQIEWAQSPQQLTVEADRETSGPGVSPPLAELENRIGFEGVVAPDRGTYVGRDVSSLFRPGSANPVRYLPLDALIEEAGITPVPSLEAPSSAAKIPAGAVEPGLLERVLPLLEAFEKDLLWAQSRAGQELFHSSTIAWLLRNFPIPCSPLLDLFGARRYESVSQVDVWRERRHLDIVIDPVGAPRRSSSRTSCIPCRTGHSSASTARTRSRGRAIMAKAGHGRLGTFC
jgi:hypothetical protein